MRVPKVSIGMPVYNGESFIREALDSLLAQTFTDFELIISDNASTDGTEVLCQDYSAKDKRIRYIRQTENRGALANFQFVLDEALGEYFMWAAADDRRSPVFLEYTVEVLNRNNEVGLVFCEMFTENLITRQSRYSSCGFISSDRKYKKYLFRLLNSCPSLIYGLHRITILRKCRLRNFDYFDVHLTHWYELNSNVKVIPLVLYTAGTNNNRIPYSFSGFLVSSSDFIEAERELLAQHFSFVPRIILLLILKYLYFRITKKVNQLQLKNLNLYQIQNNLESAPIKKTG